MTIFLSDIKNATSEQRDLKQYQTVMVFMLVEGIPTKAGIARFSDESQKLVLCIQLPHRRAMIARTWLLCNTKQWIAHTQKPVILTFSQADRTLGICLAIWSQPVFISETVEC